MDKLINIGVLSTANIAERMVIPAIKGLNLQYKLAGIASRSITKGERFSNKFQTNLYENYNDLLNDKNIDAVYIPLPNSLHLEWVKAALENDKHVLVEKSLGCSYEEVFYLTTLARKRRLVLLENFQFRFHPQINLINDLLKNDEIGELRSLRASFGFPPFLDTNNIRYDKNLGGGALLDAGAYTTKISQILLGYNLSVKAASLIYDPKYSVDIWGGAYLQDQTSGIFSEIAFGFDNYYQCGIEIWGSKGRITTNRLFTAPFDYTPEILLETSTTKQSIKSLNANHFENMLLHFYKLVTTKVDIDLEHEQNLDQARLLNEIKNIAYEK
jgi:predicted dehydrogenase